MKRLALVIAAVALAAGSAPLQAGPQCHANSTPANKKAMSLVIPVACNGRTGYCGCGPGYISACAPRCCRCVPCW